MQTNDQVPVDPRVASHTNAALRKLPKTLTGELLIELRTDLPEDKRAGAYLVIGSTCYSRLIGNPELMQCFDPEPRHSVLMTGLLGVLYGMDVLTDAYCHPANQSVPRDRVYVMSADGADGRSCDTVG